MSIRSALVLAGLCALIRATDGAGPARLSSLAPREPSHGEIKATLARPEALITAMEASTLKRELHRCLDSRLGGKGLQPHRFAVGHRGGSVKQFPEETLPAYKAGHMLGTGIQECDVSFTSDGHLVCQHSACDLHLTTNIVSTPLASRCEPHWSDDKAQCCTYHLTLKEYQTLCAAHAGKKDTRGHFVTDPEAYIDNPPDWAYGLPKSVMPDDEECIKPLTHDEFLETVKEQDGDVAFTSELKRPKSNHLKGLKDGHNLGLTMDEFQSKIVSEYEAREIDPKRVWLQSFEPEDVYAWLREAPEFGDQAVLLVTKDKWKPKAYDTQLAMLEEYRDRGIKWIGAFLPYLLEVDGDGKETAGTRFVESEFATRAKTLGFKLLAWTAEKAPEYQTLPYRGRAGKGGAMYEVGDGDVFEMIDALRGKVGVEGVFSDWSATTSFYANCVIGNS